MKRLPPTCPHKFCATIYGRHKDVRAIKFLLIREKQIATCDKEIATCDKEIATCDKEIATIRELGGTNKGKFCIPGGKMEPHEHCYVSAAMREYLEEFSSEWSADTTRAEKMFSEIFCRWFFSGLTLVLIGRCPDALTPELFRENFERKKAAKLPGDFLAAEELGFVRATSDGEFLRLVFPEESSQFIQKIAKKLHPQCAAEAARLPGVIW